MFVSFEESLWPQIAAVILKLLFFKNDAYKFRFPLLLLPPKKKKRKKKPEKKKAFNDQLIKPWTMSWFRLYQVISPPDYDELVASCVLRSLEW